MDVREAQKPQKVSIIFLEKYLYKFIANGGGRPLHKECPSGSRHSKFIT